MGCESGSIITFANDNFDNWRSQETDQSVINIPIAAVVAKPLIAGSCLDEKRESCCCLCLLEKLEAYILLCGHRSFVVSISWRINHRVVTSLRLLNVISSCSIGRILSPGHLDLIGGARNIQRIILRV